MNLVDVQRLTVGDVVAYQGITGRVSQATPAWFMVTWDLSNEPEIIRRRDPQCVLFQRMTRPVTDRPGTW